MIIDCISDLHGFYPQLEGGDLLIVAGDLTRSDEEGQYLAFFSWLKRQKYRKIVVVAGNHDVMLDEGVPYPLFLRIEESCSYLLDSGIDFEGFKIWGSPYTLAFEGENPDCLAFTCKAEEELNEHWKCIPDDTDILVTHSPPYAILDQIRGPKFPHNMVGSKSLEMKVHRLPNLKLHVFGHVHESYGISRELGIDFVNASQVDEAYHFINKPIRIELSNDPMPIPPISRRVRMQREKKK